MELPLSAMLPQVLVLTSKGQIKREVYREFVSAIKEQWRTRFGADAVRAPRKALDGLGAAVPAVSSRLFLGLKPYADGLRTAVCEPELLPHCPMVLYRGGYLDRS